jgi:tRNA dimethylallyltransferase
MTLLNKPKIVAIVGQTASGKSDLAVTLARQFNGEIVSADSRQVYRGMDIGSGKISKSEMRKVPHHLLDVADPKRSYSAARYKREATKAINNILKRDKLPIVVGGTGFYIQAAVDGLVLPEVKPDLKLRRQLDKLSASELYVRLKKLDSIRANDIDRLNPRRLIRAIEIATALGKVPKIKREEKYLPLLLGIRVDQTKLQRKITLRLKKRLHQGMLKEVERLRQGGVSWRRLEELGLEYKYGALYLQNKMSREQMQRELTQSIYQYAKRQLTWFKKDERIKWVSSQTEATRLIKSFLNT